jgi:hypothetical protein
VGLDIAACPITLGATAASLQSPMQNKTWNTFISPNTLTTLSNCSTVPHCLNQQKYEWKNIKKTKQQKHKIKIKIKLKNKK